uniref:Uncharacterized protein n=1 Tax=Anguilla anguilla TaxID=7936 RepID=A0A0E9TG16_ANGAN
MKFFYKDFASVLGALHPCFFLLSYQNMKRCAVKIK